MSALETPSVSACNASFTTVSRHVVYASTLSSSSFGIGWAFHFSAGVGPGGVGGPGVGPGGPGVGPGGPGVGPGGVGVGPGGPEGPPPPPEVGGGPPPPPGCPPPEGPPPPPGCPPGCPPPGCPPPGCPPPGCPPGVEGGGPSCPGSLPPCWSMPGPSVEGGFCSCSELELPAGSDFFFLHRIRQSTGQNCDFYTDMQNRAICCA